MKTLKDVIHHNEENEEVINLHDLKVIVKKWIEELERVNGVECRRMYYHCFDCNNKRGEECNDKNHFILEVDWEESTSISGAIEMLKHFFNLR